MAVGEESLPALLPVQGVRLGTVSAGIRKPGRKDLVLVELAEGTAGAAVFTRNAFCAAPVTLAREHLQASGGRPRYLLINTGNANAGTGPDGIAAATTTTAAVAAIGLVDENAVLPFSTGVIGEPLPLERVTSALPAAFDALAETGWADAAQGILTTDTRPKGVSVRFTCDGRDYVVTGIAKGAGMIRPDMATMLAFIATDAAVAPVLLREILADAVNLSFNRITVDGDTSTNDACVLLATGAAGDEVLADRGTPLYAALYAAVEEVCVLSLIHISEPTRL